MVVCLTTVKIVIYLEYAIEKSRVSLKLVILQDLEKFWWTQTAGKVRNIDDSAAPDTADVFHK